jgi:hypothetical protein
MMACADTATVAAPGREISLRRSARRLANPRAVAPHERLEIIDAFKIDVERFEDVYLRPLDANVRLCLRLVILEDAGGR